MEIVAFLLLVVWVLKSIAIVNATRWLKRDGEKYKGWLSKKSMSQQMNAEYYEALEGFNGKFFPFGVKDFRLRKYIEGKKTSKPRAFIVACFQGVLFRFNRLIIVTITYLLLAGWLAPQHKFLFFEPEAIQNWMAYGLATLALAANILLSAEAVYAYATLGSYAASFHMQCPKGGLRLLYELKLFVGRILTTLLAGAAAFYISYITDQAIAGQITSYEHADLFSRFIIYAQCFYFTTTTFVTVGYGDIYPVKGKAQLISFLVQIQYFALAAIVFSMIQSSRDKSETEK